MFAKPILIFAVFMGFFTSLTLTLVITVTRQGITDQFFLQWFPLWSIAYPVATVCIVVYRPMVNNLTQRCLAFIESAN
jgi:hypothetical protein